ncbi:MAG: universal stress protein [Pseudomonadota bacterium]
MKILLAVDGSKYSLDAVKCLIDHADWYREKPQVELVTVHLPVPQLPRMSVVVSKKQIERYYEEEGQALLAQAQSRLGAAGIQYSSHVLVGQIAESIVAHARKTGCDIIYIGTHGRTATGKLLLGSVAGKVLHISPVPVLLVK